MNYTLTNGRFRLFKIQSSMSDIDGYFHLKHEVILRHGNMLMVFKTVKIHSMMVLKTEINVLFGYAVR